MVLENPGLEEKSCITEALYAGLQLIMPGGDPRTGICPVR